MSRWLQFIFLWLGTTIFPASAHVPHTPGAHQLHVTAEHSFGLFSTNTSRWFTNTAGQMTRSSTFDGAGQITQRLWKRMQVTYPTPGIVSVWIGSFTSESDFDRCVDGPIAEALRLPTNMASICEVTFQDDSVSIRELLEGFSGWESFVEQAEAVANARGIATANAALVCYYVKCGNASEIWDKMHFLGSFAGQDVH